jgi:energy-converting hydrogenase Eha subunit C
MWQLKTFKMLFLTGASGNCVRIDSSQALGNIILGPPVDSSCLVTLVLPNIILEILSQLLVDIAASEALAKGVGTVWI